jgi:predicted aspartyl protease
MYAARKLCVSLMGAAITFNSTVARAEVNQATVPLVVEGNRPFVDINFRKADGSARPARLLVDTGGGGFLLTESLARELGLEWGTPQREQGNEFAAAKGAPQASVGGLPLELNVNRIFVVIGKDNILPKAAPGKAEGMFPGHVLARYHVIFDYPSGKFTIARPGVLTPRGEAMPMPVGKQSGFPRTEVEVAGQSYGFLLDTGAAFTMVSDALLKQWGNKHAEWARHAGGHGEAALLGGQTIETMYVPEARWCSHELGEMGVTSQREGTFEGYMSSMMAEPIVGALAGNVLKRFRIELDYKNEKLYVTRP